MYGPVRRSASAVAARTWRMGDGPLTLPEAGTSIPFLGEISMSTLVRETLTLTLPPDPAYARLARLAALHFLRAQGLRIVKARLGARAVESRSKRALTAAARRTRAARPLALTCTSDSYVLEVKLTDGQARNNILVMKRQVAG